MPWALRRQYAFRASGTIVPAVVQRNLRVPNPGMTTRSEERSRRKNAPEK